MHIVIQFPKKLGSNFWKNEMELFLIVWAFGRFWTTLYGVHSQRFCDWKALASALKGNGGNRTYFGGQATSRDRFLLIQWEVCHFLGCTLGFADYLSPYPSPIQGEAINAEEIWKNWFNDKHGTAVDFLFQTRNWTGQSKRSMFILNTRQNMKTSIQSKLP